MFKKHTKILAIFFIIILLFSSFVFAENEISDNGIMPISEQGNEVENSIMTSQQSNDSYKKSDVYLLEKNVTIDYIVDGNLFVCADTVTINSQIGGDAFIIAKTLIVDEQAYIFNNLFVTADSIEIKGIVYDVYSMSRITTISGGKIYRDAKLTADTFNINGTIGRNAFVTASNINFNTDGNSKGVIHGNLDYYAKSEISIPENSVNGDIHYNSIAINKTVSFASIIADYILDLGAFISFVLIIWLICLWLAPKFLENSSNYISKKLLLSIGLGLLFLLVVPIICFILLLLQLTAGVSLLLLVLYILFIAIARTLFTISINNYICTKLNITKNIVKFGILILTTLVIWGITQIPYVSVIVSIATIVIGLGILILSILPNSNKNILE
ncbi:MAG: hypothetical protein HFJ59_03130 [Clostridia bacterium]|nr:hypothetical protein [Clostridia bacterium]